jgi:hypothetical protein
MADTRQVYGQKSTLGASTLELHINIEDQVEKFPKYRRELINRLDGKNFKKPVKSHKYEWSLRENRPLSSTLSIEAADDATSMVVADPGVFNVDDLFQDPNGAQYVVTAVAGGVNVTFEKLSGTQQTLAAGSKVIIVGGATPQGKNADDMVTTGFDDLYNYTSIIEDVVDLSGTQHHSLIRGDENSGELIARKQMELTEKLQRQLIAGIRTKADASKRTTMGGLKYMIDTYAASNAVDFGGDIWASDTAVQDKIDDVLDIIAEKAFEKPVMYVTPAFMKKFKYIQADRAYTTVGTSEKRGIGVVKKYDSHVFGLIDVVQLQGLDGLMDDFVGFVDESMIGYKAMRNRGWFTTPLAKLGDSYRWQVLGEYTFKMDIPQANAYMYDLGL